ncbi:MAG: HdeD family acid-resistance protein [Solirubrobacteraceae bacterium]
MPAMTVKAQRLDIRPALEAAGLWWLLVLMGVVSLVAGGLLVAKPSHSLATLCVIFGIFLLLDGIVAVVYSFRHEANRGLAAIMGVLAVVFGIILIRHPTHAVTAIGLLIGLWLVAAGVVRLIFAIMEESARFVRVAVAVLEIIVGIVVVSDPHIGYATLAVLVGIWLIINGVGMVGLGLILRKARSELAADAEG